MEYEALFSSREPQLSLYSLNGSNVLRQKDESQGYSSKGGQIVDKSCCSVYLVNDAPIQDRTHDKAGYALGSGYLLIHKLLLLSVQSQSDQAKMTETKIMSL